ncbi:Pvc16 family protein [Geodermatophilus sp. SYSU D00758]
MAAYFQGLNDVTQVLVEHIRAGTAIEDVQAGAPRDVAATSEAAARITLLYTTPQPGHRNDPPDRRPDGSLRPPPLVLSCFYLVTTSGTDVDDPVAAHHALGRIMALYHDTPALRLPLSDTVGAASTFTTLGEGDLGVVQVPIALDQVDKIWTSLEAKLQPWVLFEVAPVALLARLDDREPVPVVRPGGVVLGVRAGTRPLVTRVSPAAVRAGGRVRIDAALPGTLTGVAVGGVAVAPDDASLAAAPAGTPLLLSLDNGGLEALSPGAHALSLRAAGLPSRPGTVRVADPAAPAVDAPGLDPHDPATDLVLTGVNLGGARETVLWPDEEVATPADVRTLAVADVTAESVTISAADLSALPARAGAWRLTLRVGDGVFTPYVVLELGS